MRVCSLRPQFAVVAARAAVKDAQLEITEEIALQAGTIVGNSAGGQNTFDESYFKLYVKTRRVSIP